MVLRHQEYDRVYNEDYSISYDYVWFEYQASENEVDFIRNLTSEYVYNHMKKQIGIMTPCGDTKLIPQIVCGNVQISVQINYQLWSKRDDENRNGDNSPITQEEFDMLVPKSFDRYIDVRVQYNGETFIKATQMTIDVLVLTLQHCVCDE